jgi:hypothetical protein
MPGEDTVFSEYIGYIGHLIYNGTITTAGYNNNDSKMCERDILVGVIFHSREKISISRKYDGMTNPEPTHLDLFLNGDSSEKYFGPNGQEENGKDLSKAMLDNFLMDLFSVRFL